MLMSQNGEILSLQTDQTAQTGKKYVTLSAELGEDEYNRLCSIDGFTLKSINYCQRGLSLGDVSTSLGRLSSDSNNANLTHLSQEPGVESMEMLRDLINHDYLVLEVQPGDPSQAVFYIVAQKLSGDKPGIHISPVVLEKKDEVLHEKVLHYAIDCKGKQIPLLQLIDILKEGDPHYSLRNANCWDYATAAAKRLVQECAHQPGNSAAEKARLLDEHDNLEGKLARRSIKSFLMLLKERALSFVELADE